MDSDRALRLLKVDCMPSGVQLVKCTWLSLCISEKQLLDVANYSLLLPKRRLNESSILMHLFIFCPFRESETQHANIKEELPDVKPAAETIVEPVSHQTKEGETIDMVEEDGVSQSDLEALITGQHPKEETPSPSLTPSPASSDQKAVLGKWVCAQSSQSKSNNFNKHITDKLEVLAKAYTHQGDKWRALGYSKAVNALKSYHKPVTSYQVMSCRCF
uniref:DNA polymerase lambda-like n=1 Tax=Seriola lalandi dorsalis TaxID=1841481 RepID=A0A3B4WC57_SERLL